MSRVEKVKIHVSIMFGVIIVMLVWVFETCVLNFHFLKKLGCGEDTRHQVTGQWFNEIISNLNILQKNVFDATQEDLNEKSLSKTNPDPVEEGKAILAMPFNLATQMIMGKKAPSAVSADDRLKESVLVLLKQSDQRFGNV